MARLAAPSAVGGAMSLQWVEPLSGWLQQAAPSGGYLLLSLNSCTPLANAYGSESFRQALVPAFEERLTSYGVSGSDILVLDHLVLVALGGLRLPPKVSKDRFLEQIKAALSYEPVLCGSHRVLVNVLATWIETTADIPAALPALSSDLHSAAKAIAFAEVASQTSAQTRLDMALASQFFGQMHDAKVVLSFQPVVFVEDGHRVLYYEALLRRTAVDDSAQPASCGSVVQALERLHGSERLDASVFWTVIHVLEQHPDIHLACNISPLSLRHGGWWRLIFSVLSKAPDLARRLTLEITETAAVFDVDEALNLLKTLRLLGCKIAIDNIGAGFSILGLATQIKPDVIKIDKTLMHSAREQGGFTLLHSWIEASRDVSQYVVAEGIETEGDLQLSIDAGAHAVQGYFIKSPSIQPPWGAEPVCVQDSFNPTHRSIAINQYFLEI